METKKPSMNASQAMKLVRLEDHAEAGILATVEDAERQQLSLFVGRQVAQRFPIGSTVYLNLVMA